MGDRKKIPDNLICTAIDKEANILDQLESYKIYFQHIADNTSLTGNTSQFNNKLWVSICFCNWSCVT
jgi:hypothetical protein